MARWMVIIGILVCVAYPWHASGSPLEVVQDALGKNAFSSISTSILTSPSTITSEEVQTTTPKSQITGDIDDDNDDDDDNNGDSSEVEDWLTKAISKLFILFLRIWVLIKAAADGVNLDGYTLAIPQASI